MEVDVEMKKDWRRRRRMREREGLVVLDVGGCRVYRLR